MRIMPATAIVAALVAGGCTDPASALTPMETVHAFCRGDARGDRLLMRTWPNVAALIDWVLEPAWDHVVLIDGYEVGEPRYEDDEHAVVDVTYHVAADVRGGRVAREPRQEKRAYRLVADDSQAHWRILGPAPPPHVFASQVDAEAMGVSLDPVSGDFLSAAAFVRQYLNGAGWDLSSFAVTDMPTLTELTEVVTPAVGDIVLYYDGDAPYHLGVLESEDAVLSATLNGGIRRAPLEAFAGTVRFRRPRASARVGTPTAVAEPTRSVRRSTAGKKR
jgi:hypothetical protein